MNENNAAQAVQESERNAAVEEYFGHRAWIKPLASNFRLFEAGFDRAYALLSKLRAEGVQAGDERAAFASHVSGRDDLELYQVENVIDANSTRWATWRAARDYYQQARASLESAPVAGEAQAVAWKMTKRAINSEPMFTQADPTGIYQSAYEALYAAPKARDPQHPDDAAVDRFAAAMKSKLAKKRAEGRGGWEDKEQCGASFLSQLLREHVEKGDPLDVGNLAMMLHQRGEAILAAPQASEAVRNAAQKSARAMTFDDWLARHCDSDDLTAYERELALDAWNAARSSPQASAESIDLAGIDADRLRAIAASGSHTAMSNALLNVARALKTQTQADKDGGSVDLSTVPDIALEDEIRKRGAWVAPQADKDGGDCGDCAKGAGDVFGRSLTPYGLLARALRVATGTTLMQMARDTGSTPAEISSYEFGRKAPDESWFERAALFFASNGIVVAPTALRKAHERAALTPTPSVVKQSLTATQTGEKGEKDAG